MVKDHFEIKEITYDSSIRTYIFRVLDARTNQIANVTVADTIEKGINSNSAYISLAGKNFNGSKSEIIENNSTNKDESFKAVFEEKGQIPSKVFVKDLDNKWVHFENPPEEFIDIIKLKRLFLRARIDKKTTEASVFFVR